MKANLKPRPPAGLFRAHSLPCTPCPSTLATVNLSQFNQPRYNAQLFVVYTDGAFLATRRLVQTQAVNLYTLPGGFFVE
jgi:hypothetical protein